MKIGIVSPFMPHEFAGLFDEASKKLLPGIRGVLATPVTGLARGWLERGHTLSVFCLDQSVSSVQVLRGEDISIHVIPKRRARYCLQDFYRTECRLIRESVHGEAPEVLSAQWSYEHAFAALQCEVPTVVTCHDAPLRCAWIAKNWFTTCHLAVAWRVIRKAKRLVCVSPYTAAHIQKYFRPQGAMDVVPNGLMPEVFQRGERRLQKAGSVRNSFVLCSVGGWGVLKNIATLLIAFASVRERHPFARLVLFGRNLGTGQAAEEWARHRQLHQGVVFNGSTAYEKILDFLESDADLMVHPSLIEANPMVLMEAMACGVPVVAGRHSGGVPWTLDDGRCGYLCDIRDEGALAETILNAMNQPDQRRALVSRAFNFARDRFNQERAVSANEKILREMLTPVPSRENQNAQ